jgi:hypothetical protein
MDGHVGNVPHVEHVSNVLELGLIEPRGEIGHSWLSC